MKFLAGFLAKSFDINTSRSPLSVRMCSTLAYITTSIKCNCISTLFGRSLLVKCSPCMKILVYFFVLWRHLLTDKMRPVQLLLIHLCLDGQASHKTARINPQNKTKIPLNGNPVTKFQENCPSIFSGLEKHGSQA